MPCVVQTLGDELVITYCTYPSICFNRDNIVEPLITLLNGGGLDLKRCGRK